MKRNGGFDALNHKLLQGAFHAGQHFLARLPAHDEFGNHRIVIWRNGVARVHVAIYAHAVAARQVEIGDFARTGSKAVAGVFGVDSALHRKHFGGVVLARNRVASGYFYLFFY